jgi:glycerol kinase
MSRYVLALDQGTTSSRAILFDEQARAIAVDQREFPQSYPQPGWVEHDPEAIWESQLAAARGVLARAAVPAAEVTAIGITNQRETALVWERATGRPIYPAIVWQSRQTASICDDLRGRGLADQVRARTGLVIDAYFSATKIRFILDAVPGAQARAAAGELAFGTVDSWLLWRLTGGRVHATDETNASRTMLWNIHAHVWDDALLAALNVPRPLLPEVRLSSGDFGDVDASWLGASIPIRGVAGDQQAALFGQRCTTAGAAKNTYGTGCFLLMHTGARAVPSHRGLLTTVAARVQGAPPAYALEGSVFSGGSTVQWLRDGLGMITTAAEVEALAASVPDSGGVVLVPAFTGLGAPYWDESARGALLGITRGTTRAHIARAALDAIAHQSREVVECLAADAGESLSSLRVDGGACRDDLLMQIQADLLGIPVHRPAELEVTALGAAGLAGIAAGVWGGVEEFAGLDAGSITVFEPRIPPAERAHEAARWGRAVQRALRWGADSSS